MVSKRKYKIKIDRDFSSGFKSGLGFFVAIILLFALFIGVYAFVEPTSGPSINNVMSSFTSAQASVTANSGMYNNRIPESSFPNNYTEICYKSGSRLNDQHVGGQSTAGGNCLPGDVGFVIEQNERAANYWEQAKDLCLRDNMRLPEPFEYKLACVNATTFGLNSMTGNWEWASNFALPILDSTNNALAVGVMGTSGCGYSAVSWVGTSTGVQDSYAFRCVR